MSPVATSKIADPLGLDGEYNNRVLVVDDNVSIHQDFEKILGTAGSRDDLMDDLESFMLGEPELPTHAVQQSFELSFASQGRMALTAVREAKEAGSPIALAFVDMRMPPGWDGVETIENLWAVDEELLCVICTAYSDHSWDEMVRRLSCSDRLLILKKPFDVVEVKQLASSLTKRWNLAREARLKRVELESLVEQRTQELERVKSDLLLMNRDLVTARDHAEAGAEAKSVFLATMSHEIRTPMNGVIGMADLLTDTELDADQRECVEIIQRSGEALLCIINDILDFSKIEARKMLIEPVPTDLGLIFKDVKDVLMPMAESSGIGLTLAMDEALPAWVSIDPVRIRQVLMNIAGNAVKFTREGSVELGLECAVEGEHCRLRIVVSDSGIGIRTSRISDLFEEFTQADVTTTREFGGTGLGLAISKQLVDLMGGEISVASEFGVGTQFTIDLAVRVVSSHEDVSSRLSGTGQICARVLLVEDNAVNQLVARRILQKIGCSVVLAEDGEQAVEASREGSFDVIFMDCQMPRMDGYAATAAIRAEESGGSHVNIIAMTANALEEDRQRCFAAGMDDFVAKPINQKRVRDVLSRWVPPNRDETNS